MNSIDRLNTPPVYYDLHRHTTRRKEAKTKTEVTRPVHARPFRKQGGKEGVRAGNRSRGNAGQRFVQNKNDEDFMPSALARWAYRGS